MAGLVEHLDIKNFRNNDAVNMKPPKGAVPDEVIQFWPTIDKNFNSFVQVRDNFDFIRKGIVGDWKELFGENPEVAKEWDEWIENNANPEIPIKFALSS